MFTEQQDQEAIFTWANHVEKQFPMLKWLHCSLNGVKMSMQQAMRAKRAGMKRGISDISLPYNNGKYSGLYIELKRLDGGTTSKEQKEFLAWVNSQGYLGIVCNGCKDAINAILSYIQKH